MSTIKTIVIPVINGMAIHKDSYILGLDHMNMCVQSFRQHISFGPEAGPVDGQKIGIESLKSVVADFHEKAVSPEYWDQHDAALAEFSQQPKAHP